MTTPAIKDKSLVQSATYNQGLATKEPTLAAGTIEQYYRGDKTWQALDKTAIGLGNVDNTSDADKPISIAVANVLGDISAALDAINGV